MFSRTLLAAAQEYKIALEPGGEALEQAKRRLEQYGLVWEQMKTIPDRQVDDKYFGILSSLTGTIVKTYVSDGQYVKEGERLFEIADFTKMWFHFMANEKDLPFIKVGQVVTVRVPSLPSQEQKTRVSFISPIKDEQSLSTRVRVVLENPERRLRCNTFTEGIPEVDAPEVVTVPRSAVLYSGSDARVYVEKSSGVYEWRNVKLGRAGDEYWEVLYGAIEGERAVSSDGVFIDGQASLTSGEISFIE